MVLCDNKLNSTITVNTNYQITNCDLPRYSTTLVPLAGQHARASGRAGQRARSLAPPPNCNRTVRKSKDAPDSFTGRSNNQKLEPSGAENLLCER